MADNDAVIEQLRKDNEDLRRQLGDMTTQLERLTTLFMEQHTNTTAGPSVAHPTVYLIKQFNPTADIKSCWLYIRVTSGTLEHTEYTPKNSKKIVGTAQGSEEH